MYKQPYQTGKDKKAHRALLNKDKQAKRDVLMWKFSVALKLLQSYTLDMTDKKADLLSQKEAANISDITNTIYRFFAVAFSKSPKKKELETLMFENVAALIEVIDITLQIPPEKAEEFSSEALELAKRLTNQFIEEKQNGI
jgi:hypothetical protein